MCTQIQHAHPKNMIKYDILHTYLGREPPLGAPERAGLIRVEVSPLVVGAVDPDGGGEFGEPVKNTENKKDPERGLPLLSPFLFLTCRLHHPYA